DIHNTGLIHRDLKPSNILLTTDGPRVIDFGIARAVDDDPDRTHTGELVGSPGFMSPEQAEGKPLTAASDVFALGSLLAMAATGKAPFDGVTAPQTLYNIIYTEPDLSGVASPFREIIAACLAKDPARRPTPQQILDHIGPPPPTTHPWPAPIHEHITKLAAKAHDAARTSPKRGKLKVAGAALAAAAVGGGAVLSVLLIGLTDQQKGIASAAGAPPSSETTVDNDPLSANRLRAVDPCAVFDDGVEPVIGVHFDMCTYTDPDGHWLELKIGTHVPSEAVPSGEIAGLPVSVDEFGSRGHCRAIAILPEDPANGITVQAGPGTSETPKDDYCGSAKEGLGDAIERITSGTASRTGAGESLATVDPCTLIEAADLQRVFSIAPTMKQEGLHSCSWQVNGKIKLDLENAVPPGTTESEEPIELGGIDAFEQAQPAEGSPSCTISWSHRDSGRTFDEVVRLRYLATGTGLPVEEVCEKAREAAASIIPRLPAS
ncbi:protein kinase, partial [Saccharomonospora sp. NPDC006951]